MRIPAVFLLTDGSDVSLIYSTVMKADRSEPHCDSGEGLCEVLDWCRGTVFCFVAAAERVLFTEQNRPITVFKLCVSQFEFICIMFYQWIFSPSSFTEIHTDI